MIDTWFHTRSAVQRLRYAFAFWLIGLGMMATAIVTQFGWLGVLFCAGIIVWRAGAVNLQ